MNCNFFYPALGVLALAVSPLLAQQDAAPAPPAAPVVEDEPAAEAEADAEMLQLQPAQRGVVIERAVVVRGNNGQLVGRAGGLNARAFDDDLAGLAELALGAVTDGVTNDSQPSTYRFDAPGPGLLTVAVRAKDGDDLTIEVYDTIGQQLARCDIDFGGDTGAEHLALPISAEGSYRVVIQPLGGGGAFWMGASWLAFEELEAVATAGPEDAIEITPGQPQEAVLEGVETWFTYTAPAAGLLLFSTTADRGDLVLEAYYENHLDQQVQHSDQDRNGNGANERILIDLAQDQVIYIKARSFGSGQDIEFNATSRFIEDE